MKLQRRKIKLNEFDYQILYLPGKENHISDALSRVKIEENIFGVPRLSDTRYSTKGTKGKARL